MANTASIKQCHSLLSSPHPKKQATENRNLEAFQPKPDEKQGKGAQEGRNKQRKA
jgi:hypothetical protein